MPGERPSTSWAWSAIVLAVAAAGCTHNETAPPPAEVAAESAAPRERLRLYVGPTFVTGDASAPEAKAIVTDENGVIREVLAATPADTSGYDVVTVPGALALPGLHDAHAHLLMIGQREDRVDLLGARTPVELKERVAAFARAHPDATVIRGRGWDQSLFPGQAFPTAQDLEGATDRPVLLSRVDGHAVLVNRALLEKAGIDKRTKDPEGGRVLRDKSGAPTGVLVDNAMSLVDKVLPAPSAADLERWLVAGTSAAADAGLVAVHDMGFSLAALPVLRKLDAEGRLPIRVFVYLDGSDAQAIETAASFPRGARFEVRGVKLFADGAMGSRGAALLEDYSDERGHRGLLLTEPKVLEEQVRRIHLSGKQAAIHAIGDRGNRVALEAIAAAEGAERGRRHRVEHAQLLHPDDFAAFSQLGAIASMQPTHATSDMRWAEARVGKERVKGAYAWRTLLDSGAPLAFGSDAPVESERAALGLYAAVTRQDASGAPEGGWLPEERLGVDQAIRAFSAGAAFAVGREHELGVLKPGYTLDVSAFDRDPRNDAKQWLEAAPTATIVAGALREREGGR